MSIHSSCTWRPHWDARRTGSPRRRCPRSCIHGVDKNGSADAENRGSPTRKASRRSAQQARCPSVPRAQADPGSDTRRVIEGPPRDPSHRQGDQHHDDATEPPRLSRNHGSDRSNSHVCRPAYPARTGRRHPALRIVDLSAQLRRLDVQRHGGGHHQADDASRPSQLRTRWEHAWRACGKLGCGRGRRVDLSVA